MKKINFLHRLTQLRESGVRSRIRQHYITSKPVDADPSTSTVNFAAVAPILVVLAAGNVIAILLLVIERHVHRSTFKCWPRENIRRPDNNVRNQRIPYLHIPAPRPSKYRLVRYSIQRHKLK
jgi:hypothetical protein